MGQYASPKTKGMNALCDVDVHWKEREQITDWDLDEEFEHQTSNSLVTFLI